MWWFTASIIGTFCIAGAWLSLKQAQQKGESNEDALIKYFIALCLIVLVWHLVKEIPILINNLWYIFLLFLASISASASNLLVLQSFKKSSNPGFSLALSSTAVIWVTIIGLLFFNATITLISGFGIIFVIIGVGFMHVRKINPDFRWGFLALTAGILNAVFWVIIKLVQSFDISISAGTLLFYTTLPQIPIFYIVKKLKGQKQKTKFSPKNVFWVLVVGGIIGALGNGLNIFSVANSPNPGYPLAIITSSSIITLFFSKIFFGSRLEIRQVIATFLIILGIVAIRLGA